MILWPCVLIYYSGYVCSLFMLFVAVMFSKVIANAELENTELLLLGEIQG